MPGWAGSSFYFNRYMDSSNTKAMVSEAAVDYWQEVDLYIGGSEHATGHLLYARFWQKFLYDLGFVPKGEFAKKLINQGMITGTSAFVYRLEGTNTFVSKGLINGRKVQALHADISMVNAADELDIIAFKAWRVEYANAQFELEEKGVYTVGREVEKMSKSKYNVVSPDAICDEYGADSLRLYEMFLGPLEQSKPWNTAGITGTYGFIKKLWKLYFNASGTIFNMAEPTADQLKTLHKTIKKVTEDIESFSFNTAVSTFMICVNELTSQGCKSKDILEALAILVSPYAPHVAEELWAGLGHKSSISLASFPIFNSAYLVESEKEYPVSFNGKMRFKITLPMDFSKDAIEAAVMAHEKTQQHLEGRTPKKVIVVPGKIINIVE
jgi:leucyl-tRNA synthetase